MGDDVVISFYGTAIRPWLWTRLYESLSMNSVPFELILVGDRVPKFKLPDNFHFIYSEVKPAQCAEIASRYTTGDLIMNIVDDLVFSEHALDNLYKMSKTLNNDKIMLTCKFVRYGKEFPEDQCRFWSGNSKSPMTPVGGLMKREMWHQLGGIDRRFVTLFWDLDMGMRMYEIGGAVVRCENAWVEEIMGDRTNQNSLFYRAVSKTNRVFKSLIGNISNYQGRFGGGQQLYAEYGKDTDRPLLDSFWVVKNGQLSGVSSDSIHCTDKEKGTLSRIRLSPVVPFEDKHILTVSQGPKGRWR